MKRIVLYRFDRQPVDGLVRPDAYLSSPTLEFLTPAGDIQTLPLGDVKALCFVSDASRADLFQVNTRFERRPKSAGVWARFTLRDGDQLEGLLPHNLVEWPASGFSLTPPHAGASRQRVFLPRMSVLSAEVLGIVGVARATSSGKRQPAEDKLAQLKMFDQ